jgi:hypothetical protein
MFFSVPVSFGYVRCVPNATRTAYDRDSKMQTSLGVIPMKHPVRSDFDTAVTEAGVTVTFKPTNSIYSFYRLADSDDVARLGPVSLERVRHRSKRRY